MLDHLQRKQHVEELAVAQGVCGLADAVVNVQQGASCMRLRDGDVSLRRIHTHHPCTARGQRLAHQTRTTSDVGDAQVQQFARQAPETAGDLFENVAQTQHVDDMQGTHRPSAVPSGRRQSVESRNLVVADGTGSLGEKLVGRHG